MITGNTRWQTGWKAIVLQVVLPLYRRCALLAGVVGAVITDWRASPEGRLDWWLLGSLITLQTLALLAASHMLAIIGALRPKFDPLSRLNGSVTAEAPSAWSVGPAASYTAAPEAALSADAAAASSAARLRRR